jgi:uncharacterized membrane protein
MSDSIMELALATGVFFLIHVIPSSYLRKSLVGKVGLPAYLGGFSLLSAVSLFWMITAFAAAPFGNEMWAAGNVGRYTAIGLMALASILFIGPFTGISPTGVGGQKSINNEGARSGINAITRHPLLWSFVIWSGAHLVNNSDLRSVIFFGGFGGLALAGTFLIDAKRKHELKEKWADYTAHTSNIPFLAILQGKAGLSISRLWWRVALGLILFMGLFHTHSMLIGFSPFPL